MARKKKAANLIRSLKWSNLLNPSIRLSDWIDIPNDPKHVAREKQKARQLRKSQWWKNQIAAGICFYCKRKFRPSELTMDHLVPLARGGKSTRGNIVPCCKECNNKKKYRTPAEMLLEGLKKEDADT